MLLFLVSFSEVRILSTLYMFSISQFFQLDKLQKKKKENQKHLVSNYHFFHDYITLYPN